MIGELKKNVNDASSLQLVQTPPAEGVVEVKYTPFEVESRSKRSWVDDAKHDNHGLHPDGETKITMSFQYTNLARDSKITLPNGKENTSRKEWIQ